MLFLVLNSAPCLPQAGAIGYANFSMHDINLNFPSQSLFERAVKKIIADI
jgi:hypothetical protein